MTFHSEQSKVQKVPFFLFYLKKKSYIVERVVCMEKCGWDTCYNLLFSPSFVHGKEGGRGSLLDIKTYQHTEIGIVPMWEECSERVA